MTPDDPLAHLRFMQREAERQRRNFSEQSAVVTPVSIAIVYDDLANSLAAIIALEERRRSDGK